MALAVVRECLQTTRLVTPQPRLLTEPTGEWAPILICNHDHGGPELPLPNSSLRWPLRKQPVVHHLKGFTLSPLWRAARSVDTGGLAGWLWPLMELTLSGEHEEHLPSPERGHDEG